MDLTLGGVSTGAAFPERGAVVGLVGQRQKSGVVHVGMGRIDCVQMPRAKDFPGRWESSTESINKHCIDVSIDVMVS